MIKNLLVEFLKENIDMKEKKGQELGKRDCKKHNSKYWVFFGRQFHKKGCLYIKFKLIIYEFCRKNE